MDAQKKQGTYKRRLSGKAEQNSKKYFGSIKKPEAGVSIKTKCVASLQTYEVDPVTCETFRIIHAGSARGFKVKTRCGSRGLTGTVSCREPVIAAIKHGFTVGEAENVRDAVGLPKKAFFRVVGLSDRTALRKQTEAKSLSMVSSDRIWRLANILAIATMVFGDRENARTWLHRSQPGLGGGIPIEFIETEGGARAVEDLLSAILHGNYV